MGKRCFIFCRAVRYYWGFEDLPFKSIGNKPQEVQILDDAYDGILTIYNDIDICLRIRAYLDSGTDWSFLGVNPQARYIRLYWKQFLGNNSFMVIVRDACKKKSIDRFVHFIEKLQIVRD